jgi:hypothetical protein
VFVAAAAILATVVFACSPSVVPWYSLWCGIYLILAATSAVISGMPLRDFLKFEFYRYDGNVFVSFLPLLLAPAILNHRVSMRIALQVLMIATSIVLFVGVVITHSELFRSHNAFGGLVSVLLVVTITLLRNPLMWIPLVLNVLSLNFSASRGSLIGVLAACGVLVLYRRGWKRLACALPVIGVCISLAIAGFGYSVWHQMGDPEILSISDYPVALDVAHGTGAEQVSNLSYAVKNGSTIAHRVFFIWPVAVSDFFKSPLLGIGFGRFDDRPEELVGVRGVLAINRTAAVRHTDLHAHNSFLHVAAETGLVGVALIICLLVSLWRAANQLRHPYCDIVRVLLVYIILSSCTEHRMTTPAQMIPAGVIMICVLTFRGARLEPRALRSAQLSRLSLASAPR